MPAARLYGWTQLNEASPVWHVWLYEGKEVLREKLNPREGGFQGVTSVQVEDGDWEFRVEDQDGRLLLSKRFVVAEGQYGTRAWLIPDRALVTSTSTPPTSTVTAQETSSDTGDFVLGIAPKLAFTQIASTQRSSGGTAVFLSNAELGAEASLDYFRPRGDVGQASLTSLSFGLLSNAYSPIDGRTLRGIPAALWDAELEQKFVDVLPRLSVGAGAGLHEDFFDSALSLSELDFSSVILPYLSLSGDIDLVSQGSHQVDLGAGLRYDFPVSNTRYAVYGAWGWKVQAGYSYALDSAGIHHLMGRLSYGREAQATSLVTRIRSDVAFEIRFDRSLGK